jgi:hypothetical protein
VTENPDAPRTDIDPAAESAAESSDLSYDLVRDATVDLRYPGKHRRGPAHVVELPDTDSGPGPDAGSGAGEASGDYEYDLARDVPRSTQH